MITISGYNITDTLYRSTNSAIYRARNAYEKAPVILKILNKDYPSPDEIARFRREFTIIRGLESDGVVKAYELIKYKNTLIMVIEDIGGDSLLNIQASEKINLKDFLYISVKITEILGEIHAGLIVHKDINPANIIWNKKTGSVQIIDFGISTELSREIPFFVSPDSLEGTLPYISPEQTGRMNRDVDYRTDYYSLGATLYHIITGTAPFQSTDPMELVYCHMARIPRPPDENDPGIPKTVSDIIMKLMEKNAENRYQSYFGIREDLLYCLNELEKNGAIAAIEIGTKDFTDRFQIPQKLYGRQEEISELLSAYNRVCNGRKEMVLVAGYSGIGKSSLVHEINKPVAEKRGIYISGKFDQLRKNIPYSSFIEAFQKVVEQILVEKQDSFLRWKAAILEALGPNGQVILNVIPEVELLIGKQPPVPELLPAEAMNRFNLVFQNFIHVFLSAEHPLVIFLDDMQWADTPSLALIKNIMGNPVLQYVLIICAYRDNEVDPAHPFMAMMKEIAEMNMPASKILLKNLKISHVAMLLSETLHCDADKSESLAQLCHEKTRGNPFFLNQFLYSMHRKGLIEYIRPPDNSKSGDTRMQWTWDIQKIKKLQMTENVIELMAEKINDLPLDSQQVLKLAACIGNRFDLKMLSIICKNKPSETATLLWPSLKTGLIIPMDTAYKLINDNNEDAAVSYKFIHDRIQQSAYSLIDEVERPRVHLTVGQLLLENMESSNRDESLFDIVNHLNIGSGLIDNPADREKLAELNLLAGRKAKLSAAHEPSLKYLLAGIELLPAGSWTVTYAMALDLHIEAGEAAYLINNYDLMETCINTILVNAAGILDKVKAYEIKIKAEVARNMLPEATGTGLEALSLLGVNIKRKTGKVRVLLALLGLKLSMAGKSIEGLINQPEMKNAYTLAQSGILTSIGSAAYFSNPRLSLLIALKNTKLSLKHGNTVQSAFAYASYAIILSGIGDFKSADKFGRLALNLVEKFNARGIKTRIMQIYYCLASPGTVYLKETIQPTLDGFYIGLETGEIEYAAYIASGYTTHSYFMGIELNEVESRFAKYTEAIRQLQQDSSYYWQKVFYQTVLNLMGEADDSSVLKGRMYDVEEMLPLHEKANDRLVIFTVHFNTMYLNYMFQNYSKALESAGRARKYVRNVTGMMAVPIYYFFRSLTMIALLKNKSKSSQKKLIKKVKKTQKRMKQWALHGPMNHLHRWHLVEAELARVAGNSSRAMDHYEKAIKNARTHEFIQDEALACELFAELWISLKKDDIAQLYLTKAYHCYKLWGASAKVKNLTQRFPHFFMHYITGSSSTNSHATTINTGSSTESSSALDLASVLKASQAISSEIELGSILKILIQIAVENAGAQKGFLILEGGKDNDLFIEAEYTIDQKIRVLQSEPIRDSSSLSTAIVAYVHKTKKNIVLEDAAHEGMFTQDPYIVLNNSKSVLCLPIMHKGDMSGILYMENNISADTFNRNRLQLLSLLSSQAAISINNARLVAREKNSAILEKEIEMAGIIQHSLLPEKLPTIKNAEIAFKYEPMMGIGGDFINIKYDDVAEVLGMFICDVSGHGVPAALSATMVSVILDFFWRILIDKPSKILSEIHNLLSEKLSGNFLTAITSYLELDNGTLILSSAGHPPAIVLRSNGTVEMIKSRGRLIHSFLQPNSEEISLKLHCGDYLILYTDGITEAQNNKKEMLGADDELFKKWVQSISLKSSSPSELCENLYRGVIDYTGSVNLEDDFTILILKYTGE